MVKIDDCMMSFVHYKYVLSFRIALAQHNGKRHTLINKL
jgi:hypothetical protein